jgi:hypothetical protein
LVVLQRGQEIPASRVTSVDVTRPPNAAAIQIYHKQASHSIIDDVSAGRGGRSDWIHVQADDFSPAGPVGRRGAPKSRPNVPVTGVPVMPNKNSLESWHVFAIGNNDKLEIESNDQAVQARRFGFGDGMGPKCRPVM